MVVKPFLSALPSARQVRYAFRLVDLSQLSTLSCRKLRTDAGGDLYDAPAALLMHGNEADPVFCYANRTAQRLWGLTWNEFMRLPSRLSAEPLVQSFVLR